MSKPAQYFRAGAGAVIVNRHGEVLAIERADVPGAWQFPQGGLEDSEKPLDAVYREIHEETGVPRKKLELLQDEPLLLTYELPAEARREKTGLGQALYWFPFRFLGTDKDVDITHASEARNWKWMPFSSVVTSVVGFRKPMYQRLEQEFQKYLS